MKDLVETVRHIFSNNGLLSQTLPGFEKLVEGLKFDGETTGEQVAAKIISEQKNNRGFTLQTLARDPKQVQHATPQDIDESKEVEALASSIVSSVQK